MTDEDQTDTATANAGAAEGTILKILSGVQAGVEVSLVPGQYVLGSGGDDDIQIIDVSLAPSHLQLRVGPRGTQIRGMAGSVRTSNGIALDPDSDWHEVEPLDVLTVGTTRLALGPVTAAWTSITDIDETSAQETAPEEETAKTLDVLALLKHMHERKQIMPLLALVTVVGLAIWFLFGGGDNDSGRKGVPLASLAEIRTLLTRMPFANEITIRQEVDGTVYATGYVDTVVERRAVAMAIEETGVPVFLRIWVLQSMRQEVEGIIEAQKLKVTFDISRTGVVTLNGLIPDDAKAEEFISTIKERVLGVSEVISNLRTPSSLLAEIERLAQASKIKPWVLFRIDNGLVEATGALPAEEADSWSGFLQVYARRFAQDIGLRSFVQLQDVNIQPGSVPAHAITIGAPAQNADDVEVDVSRIQEGNFLPADVLVGGRSGKATQSRMPVEPAPAVNNRQLRALSDGGGSITKGHSFPVTVRLDTEKSPVGDIALEGAVIGYPYEPSVPAQIDLSNLQSRVPAPAAVGVQALSVAPATQRLMEAVTAIVTTKDALPGSARHVGMDALAVRPSMEKAAPAVQVNVVTGAQSAEDMSSILSVPPSAGIAGPVRAIIVRGTVPANGDVGLRDIPIMPKREEMAAPVTGSAQILPRQLALLPQAVGLQALSVPPAETENAKLPETAAAVSGEPNWYGIEGLNVPLNRASSTMAPVANVQSDSLGGINTSTNMPLSESSRLLLEQWRDGRLQQGGNASSLLQALERLHQNDSTASGAASRLARQQMHDRYLPAASHQATAKNVCWPASRLQPQDAVAALFWLDILSVGQALSLSSFDIPNQRALMEVALSPRRVARCIEQAYPEADVLERSVFMREIKRNPAFIRFVLRDITSFPLQVSGASPLGEVRFIQTPTGAKINEGASPDNASRLLIVGELGAVVEVPGGIASVIYGPELVWLAD